MTIISHSYVQGQLSDCSRFRTLSSGTQTVTVLLGQLHFELEGANIQESFQGLKFPEIRVHFALNIPAFTGQYRGSRLNG